MAEFKLPDIGEGIKEVLITDLLVKDKQELKKDDIIIIVESEKTSLEVSIDQDCIIETINISKGDKISPGDLILTFNESNKVQKDPVINSDEDLSEIIEKKESVSADDSLNQVKDSKKNHSISQTEESVSNHVYASPSIRKMARELDIDLTKIKGSGKNGRIIIDDLQEIDNKKSSELPKSQKDIVYNNASKWGLTEKIELNSIKQTTGRRLHESWTSIPHVTQFDECDITELDKIIKVLKRKNNNTKIKISHIPFFIKAVVKILKTLTIFNSSIDENKKHIIQKKYFNIGVAVNTERGLVVPVIKNADKKSIKQISYELTKLIDKAKNKRLTLDEMSGGCFTISSLGGISGKFFTPIINPPEVAILGISNFSIKPVFIDNKFKARKILPISLSYDHRIIDGVDGANFTKLFSEIISNPNNF